MKKRPTYEELQREKELLETELNHLKKEVQPSQTDAPLSLTELIDIDQLRNLLDHFHKLTGYAIAIGDQDNNILIGLGWQEICTKYHRVNQASCQNCKISDAFFSQQTPNHPITYKCKNGLWDFACPIIINNNNVAYIFFGQFFYDDEPIDRHFFEQQAEKYGFDKVDYFNKLDQVPILPRPKVDSLIHFYAGLAQIIADIGYKNLLIKQSQQKQEIKKAIQERDQRFRSIFDNLISGIAFTAVSGQLLTVNKAYEKITGYSSEELLQMNFKEYTHPDDIDSEQKKLSDAINAHLHEISYEKRYITKKGKTIWVDLSVSFIYDNGEPIYFVGVINEITEQKRIEQELLYSEERFKKLVENSPDIIYLYSKKRGALYWSPRVRDILGFEPNDLLKNPFKWNAAIHPDDLPAVKDAIENDIFDKIIDLEYRVQSAQGKWIWLHDRITNKKTINNDVIIEGYASDITQRRATELALIYSQNKLHTYLDSSPIGIAISQKDNTIQMLNHKFIELFGYTLQDIPTINHWFLLAYPDPKYRADILRRWDNEVELCTSRHKKFRPMEGLVRCKDGTDRVIEFSFESLGNDQITTFVDVTERKQIEQRIRKSEQQLKKLYDNTPIMMHAINMEGQLISVNQYWLNKLGYKQDEVLGKKSVEFLTESSRKKASVKISSLFKIGEIKDLEFEFVKKTGEVIDVMLSAEVQYDENRQPTSAFAMIRDVTEQKKTREKILAQNKQLIALNATKDKFFSIIAHDLRAPFNVILGFSELMIDRVKHNRFTEVERFSKLILQATNHSNNLLTNLLEWSRTQTGRIQISLKRHDIGVIINNLVVFFQTGFDTKNIHIQTHLEPNLFLLGDKHMLETVIRNLLSNAIKFTPENGFITITTKTNRNKAIISISDTGIGIEKKELAKLFKIESNYSTPGTNKETGTGLGLILCKEFIEKQGGSIAVSSEPGKGSCFAIALPLA